MGFPDRKFYLLSFCLVGLLGACQKSIHPAKSVASVSHGAEDNDLTMTHIYAQSFDAGGLQWEMKSPYGEGSTVRNTTTFKNIALTTFENGKKSSVLTAKEGYVATDLGNSTTSVSALVKKYGPGDMLARNDVVVVSTDGSRLTTDWLLYYQTTGVIETTAPVRIERQDSITTGIGMKAASGLSSVKIFKETLIIKDRKESSE
jgi:lipopolysaccharide export system protein LptC